MHLRGMRAACVPYACRTRALVLELNRSKPACVPYTSVMRPLCVRPKFLDRVLKPRARLLCVRYAFAMRSLCVP
eukprot:10442130-Alexandrium_andersonii.AAC.1